MTNISYKLSHLIATYDYKLSFTHYYDKYSIQIESFNCNLIWLQMKFYSTREIITNYCILKIHLFECVHNTFCKQNLRSVNYSVSQKKQALRNTEKYI